MPRNEDSRFISTFLKFGSLGCLLVGSSGLTLFMFVQGNIANVAVEGGSHGII